jgi:hypothetical protein
VLVKLVNALAESPTTIFRTLAETIEEITRCDSTGLSLLTRDGKTPHGPKLWKLTKIRFLGYSQGA